MIREILRAISKTGAGTLLSLFFAAATMKIVALMAGPQGIGLLSLIRQTQQTATVIGSYGGQTAVVQGLASREGGERKSFLETVLGYYLVGSLVVVIGLLSFSGYLGPLIFGEEVRSSEMIIRFITIPAVIGIAFLFVNGVLNGYRAIGRLAVSQIGASLGMLIFAYPVMLLYGRGYHAAMVFLLAIGILTGVLVGLFFAARGEWLKDLRWRNFGRFNSLDSRSFISYSAVTLITALTGTGTVLALRAMVVNVKGLATAGIFDVAWTLSMMYVMVALNSFNTYYLPTLSATAGEKERVLLIQNLFRISLLLMVPVITAVIALKPLIVTILYSGEFKPALEIIRWMLIGDFLKVVCWILAMPMLAYADLRVFLGSEIIFNFILLAGGGVALKVWGSIEGVGIAFLGHYIIYFVFVLTYAARKYKFKLTVPLLKLWGIGLLIVAVSSFFFWDKTEINLSASLAWISLALFFSWRMLSKNERQIIIARLKR